MSILWTWQLRHTRWFILLSCGREYREAPLQAFPVVYLGGVDDAHPPYITMEKTTETAGEEEERRREEEFEELIQTLPKERNWDDGYLYLYKGCWFPSVSLPGLISFQRHFQAHDTDVILVAPPKSGTTWLKALAFAIAKRSQYPFTTTTESPLLTSNPHQLVPFLEFEIYLKPPFPDLENIPSPRIFATHMPYASLPSSIRDSKCRIVYMCRNPLDMLVSYWHFTSKLRPKTLEPVSLDQLVDMFCCGFIGYGPFWDHVLGYWKASQEIPNNKVLFLKYEDMKVETISHLKILADFMGFPFSLEEERQGVIEEIARLCSFNNLKDLEVNKIGNFIMGLQYDIFFRKGEVGDWPNYLTPSMAERIDKVMEEKLEGSGLTFKTS
uniref:Sulfotransferase n=2 Tax=Davidia involucrata TaxID=16924 RepID=A0A5B7B9K4_DAVIN